MSRRKGEDTPAKKRRRLPFAVVIERTEPFRDADRRELEGECRRLTNSDEFMLSMERFGDVYWHVVRFPSAHQAEAFKIIAHRRDFGRRPTPQFGPTSDERRAYTEVVLQWGFRTGAIRRVLQAWRNTPGSVSQRWNAAHKMVNAYRLPDGPVGVAEIFFDWAVQYHPHWLHREPIPGWVAFDEQHWVAPQDAYAHSDD